MVTKSAKLGSYLLNSSALSRPLAVLGAVSAVWGAASAQSMDPNTLPQGANVVGGNATVSQSSSTLNVNQSSNRTVIDWRSFDIGSSAQVNFNQPGSSAIAVNRVNSSANPTQIEGGLHANGQVWILNPNGVFFGSGARVDAAGVVATTANIDVNQFMAGSNRLQMTGADHGSVTNAGSITVGQNGLAAFVAPSVRNSGTINAKVGKVTLAAGTTYTLDLAGDRLVEIGLGSVKAVVDQSGKIVNPGGTVALTAKAAGQVVNSVINVSGLVDASSVTNVGGNIVLGGDDITTTSSAVVRADGGANGNGGTITSVATNQGNYAGTFSAKGGDTNGDGGKIETSGRKVRIDSNISVNTLAPHGAAGNWTVDPDDLTIVDGLPSSSIDLGDSTVSNATIVNLLATTGVTLAANNSISVNAAINSSSQTSATTLALNDQDGSGLTVNLNAAITLGTNQHLTGQANLVNVFNGTSIQNGIDVALAGATVNVGAGIYAPNVTVNKSNLSLLGAAGAEIDVDPGTGQLNAINIGGGTDHVTVSGFTLRGEIKGSYVDYPFGNGISRGIAVGNGATNYTISNNDIRNVRNGILINGPSTTGTITNNLIDNTKSAVSIEFMDTAGISITGNHEGSYKNEWGVNYHLNGCPGSGCRAGAAPASVQAAMLANSALNDGWSEQDQAYVSSNRTSVVVSTTGLDTNQGSPRGTLATIQAGIDAVVSGGTVNVNNGTYTISSSYINIGKSLSLIGQSEAGVIIDARNAWTYGVRVSGPNNNVTLQNFTLYGVTASGGYGLKAEDTTNLTLKNITSQGAYKSEFDLNGVRGGTLDHLTADGYSVGTTTQTGGNGISFTNSQNITLTNSVTRNNAWGGLALYQGTTYGDLQETGITVDGTNTFNEANGIYAEDQSTVTDFGTLNLSGQGINYIVQLPVAANDFYTFFRTAQQDAIDFAIAKSPTAAAVQGYTGSLANGTQGNNIFTVGYNAAGTTALSIGTAINAAKSGATINVLAGTYAEALNIGKNVDIIGAGVGQTIIRPTTLLTTGVAHKYDTNVATTVFVHDADAVNLKGLTIDGNNLGNNAVVFWNNASGSIRESMIQNAMTFSGAQTGQGLAVDGTTGHTMNLTVADVTFRNWNKNAIDVVTGNGAATGGANVNLTVQRATFSGRGPTTLNAQNGIVLWERGGTINATIDGSRFTDIAYTGTNATAAGVLQYGSPNGSVTVSNSIFTAIQEYISTAGGSRHEINATQGNTFDGVAVSSASLDQLFAIENHLVDGIDEAGNGAVRLVAGNLYVTAAKGSIQKGVDAASSGDTVNVQAGTYSGFATSFGGPANLIIKTSQGAVIDATGKLPSTNRIVDLRADGTTISGFTINGAGNGVGISISGQGVTASGNTINNVLTGIQTTTQYATGNAKITGNIITAGYGVSLQNAGNTVSGNTVTASAEGVGLIYAANTTFSDNKFTIGASGHALNFVDSISAGGLTASGNTVNIAGGDVQGAAYLAGTNGALNLAAGSYTLGSTLLLSNNGLTVKGAGEGATTITSTATGYGISVSANDVTLSSFSYNGSPSGSYSVKVSPSGAASSRLLKFGIDHVTINGSKKTGLDLNGVNGATIDHVTVTNSTNGNGITLTDSANVTVSNSHTSGNAWGGLALYQDNSYYDQQETNITVDASNTFAEINPVYMQDSSNGTTAHGGATGLDFGTLNIAGFGYAVLNPNGRAQGDGAQFVWLQKDAQAAIDFAMGAVTNTSSSTVRGWTGAAANDVFTVGVSSRGNAMSIASAVGAANSGATINVQAGTYALPGELDINQSLTLKGAGVGSTIINSGSTGYGIFVDADGVTLSSFTFNASSAGTYGFKVQPNPKGFSASDRLANFAIDNVAINGSKKTGLDLNGVNGATIDHVAVANTTAGNGIALTDSAGVTITNTTTSNNAWGGLALYQTNKYYDQKVTNITVDGTNSFNEANGVYAEDESATNDFGTLNLAGFSYIVRSPTNPSDVYTWFQKTQQSAIDFAANVAPTTAVVEGYAGNSTSGTDTFTVGIATGGQAMSINAAVNASTSGAVIDVLDGTYVEAVDVSGARTLNLGTVTVNSLTLDASAAGSQISGKLAGGSIALNGAVTLTGNLTLDTSASNGSIVVAAVDGTAAGAQALTLKAGTGTVSLGDVGVTTRLGAVTDSNSTTLSGSTYAANSLGFGILTLAKDATFDTSANNGTIVVATVDGTTAGTQALTLKSGTGTVSLGNVGATTRLGAVSDVSTTTLTGATYAASSLGFGALTLTQNATLDTSVNNGKIAVVSVNGTTAGAQALTLKSGTGTVSLGDVGATTRLGAVSDTNTTALSGSTYAANSLGFGALTLVKDTTFDTSANNGTIVVASVDGTAAGAQALTLKAGTGTVTLGNVGATTRLGAVSDSSPTVLTGSTYAANSLGFGILILANDVALDTSANNGTIVVASADGKAAGAQALTLKSGTGTVSLGNLGATTRLGAVSDASTTTLTGSTYAAKSLGFGALTLAANATLDTSADNGAIVVASVDGTAAGAQALTLKAGTGKVSLGNLGATTRLGAVSDASATTLTGTTYTAKSLGFGALTLTGNTTLDTSADNGAIVVASVDGTTAGAQALTLKTGTGTVSLGNLGATTRLGAVSDTSATTLTGSTYAAKSLGFGALTLAANATLDTSADNGAIVLASVNGTTAGAQALTLRAGTGTVSLGNLGATTRLGAVSDATATTLTGATYAARSLTFNGNLTLTAASTTLDTSVSGGNITVTGNIFGTANGQQSLVLAAGPGTGAASANGDITLQNAGTQSVRLNNMSVSGNSFSALTVALAGNYNSHLTGNQVFAADTLDALGQVNSTVAGNAAGHVVAGGTVPFDVGGNLSGTLAAPTVTISAGAFDGTINASGTANVQADTIAGTFTGGVITLTASETVNASVTADTLNMTAPRGDVSGTWSTLATDGSGTLIVNGESNLGNSGANPSQLVVEGFALPLGAQIRPSGEIVLPQGMVLGLLSPAGASKPRVILVHDVRSLGRLLEGGYVAIVIDLSSRDEDKEETLLASN